MSIRRATFAPGEIYHIYNRGVDKREIFIEPHDWSRFQALLYLCNSKKPVDLQEHFREGLSFAEIFKTEKGSLLAHVGAYCLMPNHFHLMLREAEVGGISTFMRKLLTGYSMYFNKKHKRSGTLFQGPFQSKHVDNEPYMNWLFSYIHLNPVKLIDSQWKENGIENPQAAKEFIGTYQWSSYPDYFLGSRKEQAILSKDEFPESFKDFDEFSELIDVFKTEKTLTN